MILDQVDETVGAGARQSKACEIVGIDPRTLQRGRDRGIGDDRRAGPNTQPRNKLSARERRQVLDLVNSPEHRDLSPSQIVPILADQGVYVASESTIYRILRKEDQIKHRERSRAPQKRHRPRELKATGPSQVWGWVQPEPLDQKQIQSLHQGSPLGQILSAGLINRDQERIVMKDSIEDTGRHVVHELERYLETLGTVAAISPLLGLLGTVIGMVKVFAAITTHGVGNPTVLAGGIAEALITTAAGLTVAIPALIGYRYYRNRVDTLVVNMEKEAIKLIEALHRRQEKGK